MAKYRKYLGINQWIITPETFLELIKLIYYSLIKKAVFVIDFDDENKIWVNKYCYKNKRSKEILIAASKEILVKK